VTTTEGLVHTGERSDLPPGPRLPSLVQGALLFTSPRWWKHLQRRYGDRFTVRLGRFGTIVYLADPDDIRTVFRGDAETYHAGEANGSILAPVLGPASVLVTDEEQHQRQRRLMMPPFHGQAVARLAATMAEVAAADIDVWPVSKEFPVIERTRAITFEVILRTVIGVRDPERLPAFRQHLPAIANLNDLMMLQFLFPRLQPRWPWRRFRAVAERADRLLRDEIERCRADPELEDRTDVLALLVRARYPDGTGMDTAELRDQLMTLLMAGHETTATGLAWLLERLVRHPAVLAKAQQAAETGDDAYLDAVVSEALRARPVVPDVGRRLTRSVRLGERWLPTGTLVDPAIFLVQHDPRRYPDPDAFRPERFLGEHPDPAVWLPFGGGNRRCLGAAFALTEMRTVLGEVLRRVELATTTAPGERIRVRHVTFAPARGGRITVIGRRSRGSAGDVLVGEASPGRAGEHRDVGALDQETADHVVPQDRVAEQVDERQPVMGREVRADGVGGVDEVEHL
jgi:cytochrome P450